MMCLSKSKQGEGWIEGVAAVRSPGMFFEHGLKGFVQYIA